MIKFGVSPVINALSTVVLRGDDILIFGGQPHSDEEGELLATMAETVTPESDPPRERILALAEREQETFARSHQGPASSTSGPATPCSAACR